MVAQRKSLRKALLFVGATGLGALTVLVAVPPSSPWSYAVVWFVGLWGGLVLGGSDVE
jgi:hypothetical protein